MLAVTERAKLSLQSWLTAVLLWMVVGCTTVSAPKDMAPFTPAAAPEAQRQAATVYQLQPGDVLDVKFYYASELNEHVKIRPDGKISLQLIGEVDVVGLPPQDLDSLLRKRYAGILLNPEVAVIVREFVGQKAYVGGEVNSPGVIALDTPSTLLQALVQAGWLKKSAEPRNVVVIRNTGQNLPAVFLVDIRKWIETSTATPQVWLQPFDVVYVPKSAITKANDFVEQYLSKLFLEPLSRVIGFSFVYSLNRQLTAPR